MYCLCRTRFCAPVGSAALKRAARLNANRTAARQLSSLIAGRAGGGGIGSWGPVMAEEEGRTVEDSEPQGEERPPGGEEQPADSDSAGSHGGGDALVEDGAAPGGASSESMPEPDAAQEQPQPYDEEAPGGADTSPAGAPPEAEAAEPPASEEGRRAEAERPPGEALAQEQRTPAEQQQEDESPVQPTVVGDDAPGPDAGPTATEPAAPAAADAPAAPSAPALTVQAPEPTPSDSPARRQTATQSAPVSPARSPGTPMRSRQAAITLKDVMATGDVLLLAKSVVQERAQQRQAYAAMATHRSGKVRSGACVESATPSPVLRGPRKSVAPRRVMLHRAPALPWRRQSSPSRPPRPWCCARPEVRPGRPGLTGPWPAASTRAGHLSGDDAHKVG